MSANAAAHTDAAARRDPVLCARGVCRAYPIKLGFARRKVLRGVDLDLERGAVLGLVGPNGSGKSTLLRLLAGVDTPSSGNLTVLGGSPADSAVRERTGFLPEDSPFPGELSARAALELLGTLGGMKRAEVRARGDELLERVGLAEHARVALRRYSRGMARRFGLAQAWLQSPELILLDEPGAGLDGEGFEALDDLLAEAHGRGATVVLASHLASDVHERCGELALLLGGRVAARGTPAELLSQPGRWRLEVEDLEPTDLGELRVWVADHGGRVRAQAQGGRTLLELYRASAADE
ncbi:MAG: ABC transporter ATP-binding protein [Planctomycetota bacterium]|nr:ABC transporter ATP-binding protein [Planctomycetota bacterium]